MKISIIMTYYNRKQQLYNTLKSFRYHGYSKKQVELIIVDDGSIGIEKLDNRELDSLFPDFIFKIIYIDPKDKWYINPSIPSNRGLSAATGDIVVLQNPECIHLDDIISDIERRNIHQQYVSYACYSINRENTESLIKHFSVENAKRLVNKNRQTDFDGDNGWYNHSLHRPVAFHFTAVIRRIDLIEIGGFNELLARGIGYDDDALIHQLRNNGLEILIDDDLTVVHQWHYSAPRNKHYDYLYFKNRSIFRILIKRLGMKKKGFLFIVFAAVVVPILFVVRWFRNVVYKMAKKNLG